MKNEINRCPKVKRPKTYPWLTFLALDRPIFVYNNNLRVALEAVVKRIYFEKNEDGELIPIRRPDPGCGSKLQIFFDELRAKARSYAPLSRADFLAQVAPEKRKIYAVAVESLSHIPLNIKDARVELFPKVEKTMLKSENPLDVKLNVYPDPRGIQARPPRFHAEWGRFICAIESPIYKCIDSLFRTPVIMKGKNKLQIAEAIATKWSRLRNARAVMLDASRFDQHVAVALMRWKHKVYREFLSLDWHMGRLFDWLASKQYKTYAKSQKYDDGRFSYIVEGGLCSGDMDTSLTACLIVCALFFVFMHGRDLTWDFVDNGDDCVLFLEEQDLHILGELPAFMAQFGFVYRVDGIVDRIQRIKFCQMHPIYDDHNSRWVMVRDPNNALAKDCMIAKHDLRQDQLESIYNSIAQCGIAMAGNMPLYWSFYPTLLRHYPRPGKVVERHYNREVFAKGVATLVQEPTESMRHQFWLAFGLDCFRQKEVEEQIRVSEHHGKRMHRDPLIPRL